MWLVGAAMTLVNTALQFFFRAEFGGGDAWKYGIRMNTVSWAFTLLVGLVLLMRGEAIARAVFPHEESIAVDVDAHTLQAIGFSMLAVYLAIGALSGVATGLYGILARRPDESANYVWPKTGEHFAGALVELLAAAVLFFGTPRLVRFARRLQEPWTSTKDESPDPAP
jgi:hypothetical protein